MTYHGYTSERQRGREFMPWEPTHYGSRVVEVGEDGDCWVVSGHVPTQRALAAVLHYLRTEVSLSVAEIREEYGSEQVNVTQRWIQLVPDDDEEPWQWVDGPGPDRHEATIVEIS
jgi:hypothetical protein